MSTDTVGTVEPGDVEPVEQFRARLRAWVPDNLSARARRCRRAHRRALGPRATCCSGGCGTAGSPASACRRSTAGWASPRSTGAPSTRRRPATTSRSRSTSRPSGSWLATLLDAGTHEQKLRHLPAILQGDELWVQFLSEPSGGSDLAGCLTRADRDGDVFVLNGSKIWSSGAYSADYAMCLARTNWDVPKHRGLTMFIVKIHQPGVTVEQIRQTDGSTEFCQEFFDDVPIPVGGRRRRRRRRLVDGQPAAGPRADGGRRRVALHRRAHLQARGGRRRERARRPDPSPGPRTRPPRPSAAGRGQRGVHRAGRADRAHHRGHGHRCPARVPPARS